MAAWQGWYCVVIMMMMFGALLKNIAGPDVLMLGSLAMMLAADAVPIPEGLKGFSNKGLLTVACLFVVAAGISNTGALDYYMGKLLGHPKNAASAQIRLMVPVAFVSAFLNNTPVVAIMIPILQKWSRRVNIPNSQLMIPLSFASILGGTCTLIGTSTNLVVEGMMRERYPDVRPMGLFALSIYGVPVALSGMAYILIASPFLLPGGAGRADAAELQKKNDDSMLEDSLAVGAVVAPKSPVIDQPVATLRGLNGLYLVSVQRGDMLLRAVTPEFMLEEGDILHFTGLVESIGEVCVEHGLLPLTHEVEESLQKQKAAGAVSLSLEPARADSPRGGHSDGGADSDGFEPEDARAFSSTDTYPPRGREARARRGRDAFGGISARKTRGDYKDVLHAFQMDQDVPGGASPRGDDSDAGGHSTGPESDGGGILSRRGKQVRKRRSSFNMHAGGILRKHKSGSKYGVARGVGPGVFGESDAESEVRRNSSNDATWSSYDGDGGAGTMAMHEVMSAKDTPASVRRALLERHQILKVRVRTNSSLIGSTAMDVGFREKYKAAIIAVKRGGEDQRAANEGKLASVVFEAGDILMLHCLDKCPLLQWKEPALGARGSGAALAGAPAEEMLPALWGGVADPAEVETGAESRTTPDPLGSPSRRRRSVDAEAQKSTLAGDEEKKNAGAGREATTSPALLAPTPSSPSRRRAFASASRSMLGLGGSSDATISGGDSRESGEHNAPAPAGDHFFAPGDPSLSRPGTPGSNSPDPDLEVLSREGAEDIRAMTDFTCPVRVIPGGAVEGKTLAAAGLRGLPGLFLTTVQKAGQEKDAVAAPGADYVLSADDVLWFAGDAAGISSLRRIPGITAENQQVDKLKLHKTDRRLVQAVVAIGSPLTNRAIRDVRFRTCYDAVIIAVQRSGGRIQAKIGDIVLHAGDVLLLDTGSSFLRLYKADPAFALVSEIENSAPPQFDKLLPACGTAVVMIAVFVAGALDLFVAALLASGIMLATGCLTQNAARGAVKWEVITTIAAAFGISAAMEATGVASAIATTLVGGAAGIGAGTPGVLLAVYIATFFLCNVVGNNAAAALMYPIAAGAAEQQVIDRDQMAYLLMLAASASFMSPFGYQTNLMVYGPGGYVFADFLRFGVPMQVVQMIVSVGVVLLGDLWWVGWVAGFGAIACIYGGRAAAAALAARAETAKTSAPPFAKKLDGIEEEDETVVEKGPNMV